MNKTESTKFGGLRGLVSYTGCLRAWVLGSIAGVSQIVAWIAWVYKICRGSITFWHELVLLKLGVGWRGSRIYLELNIWGELAWIENLALLENFMPIRINFFLLLKKSIAQKVHRDKNLIALFQLGVQNLYAFLF